MTCTHALLSKNEVAQVHRCLDCGSISIHVGPITLRLDEQSLLGLSDALESSVAQLRDMQHATDHRGARA